MPNDNAFGTDKVLFYPSIEFHDDSWLKLALTVWDEVYRIVPKGYTPNDSEEVKIAVNDGCLKNIELSSEDLLQTADRFEQFIASMDYIPDGLDYGTSRIHLGKIDQRLFPIIQSMASTIDNNGFLNIPKQIAHAYMIYLSDTVSKRRNMPKLTDVADLDTVMTYFSTEGQVSSTPLFNENDQMYVQIILGNLIPADIQSTHIEVILELNNKHRESKKEFRNQVENFANKIIACEDKGFAKELTIKFQSSLLENQRIKFEIFKKIFKELKSSLLYVGLPSLTAFIAKESANISFMEGLFTGFTIAGVAALSDAGKEVRKNWNANRCNYYFDLKSELPSSQNNKLVYRDFTGPMEEFIND